MANKAISELPQAQNVNNQDLFVLEQSGIAKKLTAETFITEQGIIDALAEALDGHGGISSVTLSSVSGRIRTYLITFTDQSATTFQVLDGASIDRIVKTSTAGLTDTFTVFMTDGTTTFFTVTNGADGDVSEATLNSELAKKAPVITETVASTAIATFADGADNMPMQNVVAEIDPVQDLTYGDPYPAGGGINLLDPSTLSPYDTTYGLTSSISGDVITLSGTYTGSGTTPAFRILTVPTHENWSFKAFEITSTGTISKLQWANNSESRITIVMQNMTPNAQYNIQFKMVAYEAGTTAPDSYVPYENICPITGHTAINVYREVAYDAGATARVTLSWQNEAGTVYGGTVDVATGLLTVTHATVDLSSLTWAYDSGSGTYPVFCATLSGVASLSNGDTFDAVSSAFVVGSTADTLANLANNLTDYSFGIVQESETIVIRYDNYTDATTFTSAINGYTLCYPLATEQDYQLTGQQLKTLYGNNAVWADTGDVTVTYPADTIIYLDAQKCSKVVLTATIAASDWTSSDPYTNSVSVNGLLATDTPIMDLIASSTYATAQVETADYAYIYKATCADNALTLYASQAPTIDLNVQLLCLR